MSDIAYLDPGDVGDMGGCAVVLLVVVVIALVIVLLPILLFVFEVALLLVVAIPLVLVLALSGAAKWRIEVELEEATDDKRRILEQHRGLLAADAAIHNLANRIRAGDLQLPR